MINNKILLFQERINTWEKVIDKMVILYIANDAVERELSYKYSNWCKVTSIIVEETEDSDLLRDVHESTNHPFYETITFLIFLINYRKKAVTSFINGLNWLIYMQRKNSEEFYNLFLRYVLFFNYLLAL